MDSKDNCVRLYRRIQISISDLQILQSTKAIRTFQHEVEHT